jgi:hypothetical protein
MLHDAIIVKRSCIAAMNHLIAATNHLIGAISHFNFPGDYGGPLFLLPGLVIAFYITETPLPEPHKREMLRCAKNSQSTPQRITNDIVNS